MKNKRAIELGFNWIFALIVGSIILVLAIYGATQFVSTGEKVGQSENAAVIVSVLDSVEAGLGDGKSSEINFRDTAEIALDCDDLSNRPFGEQDLQIGEGTPSRIKNKYVFADSIINGKNIYVFSKPFYMGYKVADIIVLSTEKYCFDVDDEIKYELIDLNIPNIQFVNSLDECSGDLITVCGSSLCDIQIIGDYNSGKVVKGNSEMHYTGNLLFGAVFSSPYIYECNVKRLVNRFNELALIYREKISRLENKGCSSDIDVDLNLARTININSSEDLYILSDAVKDINKLNSGQEGGCRVW